MKALETKGLSSVREATSNWFEEYIHSLDLKKIQYEGDMMEEEEKKMMESIAAQDMEELFGSVVSRAQIFYFKKLISSFLRDLIFNRKAETPKKLAFDHKGQQIMIWAEIPTGKDDQEDKIFLSEAKVNALFEQTGFSISATVVEEGDYLDVPGHYTILN